MRKPKIFKSCGRCAGRIPYKSIPNAGGCLILNKSYLLYSDDGTHCKGFIQKGEEPEHFFCQPGRQDFKASEFMGERGWRPARCMTCVFSRDEGARLVCLKRGSKRFGPLVVGEGLVCHGWRMKPELLDVTTCENCMGAVDGRGPVPGVLRCTRFMPKTSWFKLMALAGLMSEEEALGWEALEGIKPTPTPEEAMV